MDEESDSMEIEEEPEFTLAEILEMDSLFKEMGEQAINQAFCEELTTKFCSSIHRAGKSPIGWVKVQSWFQEKQANLAAKVIPPSPSDGAFYSKTAVNKSITKVPNISASEAAEVLPNLTFEARSGKDYAWFDVATFLNYKVSSLGELFARVRFAGFGKEEDEWVSVKHAVRERSIPLEQSECGKVDAGDHVLCFRETEYHALYGDAHIMDIERKSHDSNNCTCTFSVRYEHDNTEEKVPLRKLCCRPEKSVSKGSEDPGGSQKVML